MNQLLRRWRITIETSLVVIAFVIAKLLAERYGLEFVGQNPLFTSIIAGGIFLFGLILAGTMADYKESEKIPAEIVSACESIYHEGCYIAQTKAGFDLNTLKSALLEVVEGFRSDVGKPDSRNALSALTKLTPSFLQMESLGVPPNYIVRLKSEEATIRKSLLRFYYIQRISFLPSAYILVQSLIALIMLLLLVTKIEPAYEAIILVVFLGYFFVYILRLLKTLDTPFRAEGKTMDEVSLFQIKEFIDHIDR